MKKILVIAAILVLAFLGSFAIAVTLQPDVTVVERSTVIAAPPERVFPHVNDLAAWEAWSPWVELDPQAKTTLSTPPSGKDATFTWDGNAEVGAGKMTILESVPNERLKIETVFTRPFEGASTNSFVFTPEGTGTKVVWRMEGESPSFLHKAACLVMNMQGELSRIFDKGLVNLKGVVEKEATSAGTADSEPSADTPEAIVPEPAPEAPAEGTNP